MKRVVDGFEVSNAIGGVFPHTLPGAQFAKGDGDMGGAFLRLDGVMFLLTRDEIRRLGKSINSDFENEAAVSELSKMASLEGVC